LKVEYGIKVAGLKPIRALSRSLARASFANVLTLVALSLGLLLSFIFTVFYFSQAHKAYQTSAYENGVQVAQLITEELAYEQTQAIETAMQNSLRGRAEVLSPSGEVLHGAMTDKARARAKDYPLVSDGVALGTLSYAPSQSFTPPIPYWIAALICFGVALISGLCMRFFALTVVDYVGQVTRLVGDYSLVDNSRRKVSKFAFAEFRQLALATTRATRRVSKELETLRATARMDERTGLINEPAFLDELKLALQSLVPGAQTVLVTIEVQPQSHHMDTMSFGLPSEAYSVVSDRLRLFASQAAMKHGHLPSDWILGSLFSEQFALLIKGGSSKDEIAAIIRELLGEFRVPLLVNGQQLPVTLSGSIVLVPQDGDSLSKIMDRAQATIDDLRLKSRTGFAFYSPKLERQRDAKLKLESELRQAVLEDRFVPLFQPKIDLKTGEICGAEALARWQLENGRLVSPSVFIELAEESGLIGKIGDQIMRKACVEAAKWSRTGYPVSVAVNVSPKQFEDENLSETILDALAKAGLSPRQLEIEITESLAIQQPERVRDVLEPLRRLGIKLAVDDFGTGHSNLAVLTQIDFDVFKIDRQFLMGTPQDTQANAIVDMILSMATTLEMTIVGEGIETEEQAAFLYNRHCDIGQGFLYSPPVSAVAFAEMLKSQPFMMKKKSA
jgi:EAL domain-containing protein (putative c-di-GMP-specific phosphodiesterase class I)/GGDEF domain-containing protein